MKRAGVFSHRFFDDEAGPGRIDRDVLVQQRARRAVLDPHPALHAHEVEQEHDLVVAVLEAGRRFRRAEVGRDDPVDLE